MRADPVSGGDLVRIERKIAILNRIENPISVCAGAALAVLWVIWWLDHGRIANLSWIFPLFVGGTISKFAFAIYESRLERTRRAVTHPALPVAQIVDTKPERPQPDPIVPISSEPPAAAAPLRPDDQPRLLK